MKRMHWLGCSALLIAQASWAGTDTLDFKISPRVVNDYPNSTLTTTFVRIFHPVMVDFKDQFDDLSSPNPHPFANRHDALLSADEGDTAYTFNNNQSFDVSADVTLVDRSNSPRKEAGIRVNSSIGSDGLFLINSDAGEIVAFGGPLPFYKFGDNSMGNGYTPGQTIFMRMAYDAVGHTVTYDVRFRENGTFKTSGPLAFTNLENGVIDGSTVGFYGQFSPNATGDFGEAKFANFNTFLVPEPALPTGVAAGAVLLLTRRRVA